jgi:hypothetical protein
MSRSGNDPFGNLGRDFGGIVEGIVCEVPCCHARRNPQNFLSKMCNGTRLRHFGKIGCGESLWELRKQAMAVGFRSHPPTPTSAYPFRSSHMAFTFNAETYSSFIVCECPVPPTHQPTQLDFETRRGPDIP